MLRFSINDIQQAHRIIDSVFLHSPQYEYQPLSKKLGASVLLKVETQNPIRSFKGRGADLLVQSATQPLVCASAGNFGQAMAYACTKRSLPLQVFAGVHANPMKVERMRALGATVTLQGADFDEAKNNARDFAHSKGLRFVEDGKDIETSIGAGTIGLEILTTGKFDSVIVPLGNGALINGIGTAVKALQKDARMVGVQASGAPAMIESWQQGRVVTHPSVQTIADGIGVRLPVPEALLDMKPILDEGILVSEDSIMAAMKLLFQVAGVLAEPSAAVGIAALLENPGRFSGERVAVIICGSNLTQQQINDWII